MMCHSRLCSELSISLHIASDHQCLTFLFVHKNDLADTAEHLQDLSHPLPQPGNDKPRSFRIESLRWEWLALSKQFFLRQTYSL